MISNIKLDQMVVTKKMSLMAKRLIVLHIHPSPTSQNYSVTSTPWFLCTKYKIKC